MSVSFLLSSRWMSVVVVLGITSMMSESALSATHESAEHAEGEPARGSVSTDGAVDENGDGASDSDARKYVRNHQMQGFVNMLFATGPYMVAPYDKNDPDKACGYDDANESMPVCTGRGSWHIDLLGGFGVTSGVELALMYRQGFESPEPGKPQHRMLGGGLKAYKPADGLFKLSLGALVLFDFSKRNVETGGDFVIHVPIGAQFDFVRWFGAYVQTDANISFVTEFRFDINFGIGVQARFP